MSDAITVEQLQVEIEVNSEQAVNGINKFTATLDKLKNALKGGIGAKTTIKQLEGLNTKLNSINVSTEKISKIADGLTAISKIGEIKISSSIGTQINKIGDAINNMPLSGLEKLEDTATALERISAIGSLAVSMPTAPMGNGFSGNPVLTDTPIAAGADTINNALNGVTQYNSETVRAAQQTMNWGNAIRNLPSTALQKLSTFPASIGRAFLSAGEKVKSFAGKLKEVVGSKISTGLSKITSRMKIFGKATNSSDFHLKRLMSRFNQIITYRIFRAIISNLTSAIKEGVNNLYQFSKMLDGNFSASLDRCATAFQYLKNSAGAMVAPLINALAPAIDFLIDKIVTLLNYVNALFARLSGASVYTVAKKQAVEYAEAVGDAANKAAKEIKNATLGIDELNVISPADESGGSGGASTPDFGSMFEEIPIPENVSNFIDKLKEAFNAGNWKALGTMLGEKVNEWVDSVDWEGIGRKIGYYINGAIQTAYWFLKTVDFKNIGSKIATMLNAALEEIDFSFVGRLLIRSITAGLDFLIGLLGSLNWKLIGKSIGDFLKGAFTEAQEWIASYDWSKMASEFYSNLKKFIAGLDFAGIASSFFKLLGSALAAAVSFIGTFIKEVVTDIGNYFKQYIQNDDGTYLSGMDLIKGLLKGIWEGIKGIGAWIKTNVFDPFIKGFKDVFGIHSPSTVMAELGKWIVEGFMQGLNLFAGIAGKVKEWAGAVVEWFTKGKDGKGIVENFKELAGNVVSGFREKISSTYQNVKNSITTWASSVKEWFSGSSHGGVNSNTFLTYATGVIDGFRNRISGYYTSVQSSITTWATNVKNWFSEIASSSAFLGFASDIVNGFKNRISEYYTTAKTSITTWATSIGDWFKEKCSYDSFYQFAANVIDGFKNGIGNLYTTVKNTITNWGSSVIDWFAGVLGINSPSRVFNDMAFFSIEGFNTGIADYGKTTKGVFSKWADSFTGMTPAMAFAVDTSALRYYDSASFTKSISPTVTAKSNVAVTASYGMDEEMRDAILQTAENTRRQADKREQTTLQVDGREIAKTVTTQERRNGYKFTS